MPPDRLRTAMCRAARYRELSMSFETLPPLLGEALSERGYARFEFKSGIGNFAKFFNGGSGLKTQIGTE